MRKVLLLTSLVIMTMTSFGQSLKVSVKNPSRFDRKTEMVEVPLTELKKAVPLNSGSEYVVKNAEGDIVTSQVTYDGKLIFQAGVDARGKLDYYVTSERSSAVGEYEPKAYGRFFPERMDDYIWENDRVAFRLYGEALIEKDGPSNGLDVWYKRTDKMIANQWIADRLERNMSYHKDNGTGQDDYKVGRSLGGGALAPYVNGKLCMGSNFLKNETFENGPLRVTFLLTYGKMEVDGRSVSESRLISLDAGSQYTKILHEFGVSTPMEVAAGIVKRESDDYIATSDYVIYTNVEGKDAGEAYISVLFPKSGVKRTKIDTYNHPDGPNKGDYSHVIAIGDYTPNQPFLYYAGFGWHKYGFATVNEFREYSEKFAEALKKPLVVKYKTVKAIKK